MAAALEGNTMPDVAADMSLPAALAAGADLAAEQQAVLDVRLSLEYVKGLEKELKHADEWRERRRQRRAANEARRLAAAEAAEAVRRTAAEERLALAAEARAAAAAAAGISADAAQQAWPAAATAVEEEEDEEPAAAVPPPTASGLPGVTPDELAEALRARRAVVLDLRTAREVDWGKIKGSVHAPFATTSGSSLAPEVHRNPCFLDAARAKLGPPGAAGPAVVLVGPGAPLEESTTEKFVSKEKFVSTCPTGVAIVDGEVSGQAAGPWVQPAGLLLPLGSWGPSHSHCHTLTMVPSAAPVIPHLPPPACSPPHLPLNPCLQDIVAAAAAVLQEAGYSQLSELVGGYRQWDMLYRADGRPRARGAFRDKSSGGPGAGGWGNFRGAFRELVAGRLGDWAGGRAVPLLVALGQQGGEAQEGGLLCELALVL